jgi:hypothetical protein
MAATGEKAAGGGGTATAGHPTTRGGSWALSQLGEGTGEGADRAKPGGEGQTAIMAIVDRGHSNSSHQQQPSGVRQAGAKRHD